MLQTLRVKNLALVEDITVEFGPGLNIITGETGAGKSVLVGALGLVLGERADRGVIRTGADQSTIEAAIQLDRPAGVNQLLTEAGFDPCYAGELLLRRVITPTGSGRNFINDAPATLLVLKKLGDLLVDMHGPHEHQSLLNPAFQLSLLDSYGGHDSAIDTYGKAYRAWCDLVNRRRVLEGDNRDLARRIDMLKYQCQELDDAALKPGEDEEVEREHAVIAHAQRILELAGIIRSSLNGDESSALISLAVANKALEDLAHIMPDAAKGWLEQAQTLSMQIRELESDIVRAVDKIDHDPGRLQWLDDRHSLIQKLKRKYRPTIPELLDLLAESRQQLKELENRDIELAGLGTRIDAARRSLDTAGRALGKERRSTSTKMAKAITSQLRDLGFAHGAFGATLTDIEPGPDGMDAIEFTFAPNVGEAVRPLRAIASSGEISRVMLAIKAILAGHDRIPVLVFDEIDVNIGGEMGHAVGSKLKTVASHHQVLCITHLPQVAVHGELHYAVCKEVSGGRTRTRITRLEAGERVAEIARMLGGSESASARKHAGDMLRQADA